LTAHEVKAPGCLGFFIGQDFDQGFMAVGNDEAWAVLGLFHQFQETLAGVI